jgi:uncharacterized circularly permuted ATP-grasp superfamily protein/uncharacterized alpha-E superfamily protein
MQGVEQETVWHTYATPPTGRDELFEADGTVRPHWQPFLTALSDLGIEELSRRWDEARHLIRENGVTFNVHADPHGLDRPWQLDPIPLLIDAAEAARMEGGLLQRARLLDHILADLYGPRTLLLRGILPPELILGHPGFLRPMQGLKPAQGRWLHFYAADLGRSTDGSVWVMADRTQSPAGAGYSLENRIVLSRTLPDEFHDCQVQRLAVFFRTFRDMLRDLAPRNRDNPRIVLLTPGPANETYFEHAYLARYLGLTLIEGADLTVRDNRVFLKFLGGLQPVDVIFRRLRDEWCDPLELRGESLLGVPGLVQALHAGNVAVANALGSGLLESPGLLPYLPAASKFLLGEELLLPAVRTWWCGEPEGLRHVLANLPRLVVKSAISNGRPDPIFAQRLSGQELRDLEANIRARPRHWIGQEQIPLATAPTLVGNRLEPRPFVLRAYVTAKDDGYAVMPGGLTRVTAGLENLVVSVQRGGGSKDTWVLSTAPVGTFSLLRPRVQAVELSRGGSDLPSRAADNLFWLGRYAERAEGAVRLLRSILVRLTERSGIADVPELPLLLRALTQQTGALPGFVGKGAEERLADPGPELRSLIFDRQRVGSLAHTLIGLDRVGGTARDRISADMYRTLASLDPLELEREYEEGRDPEEPLPLGEALDLLNRMVITLSALGGLAAESMTRGHGWRFLDMGRKLERATHTVGLLRSTLVVAGPHEGPLLDALLEVADCSMTYRRRYLSSLHPAPVLDLLIADETNPRSLGSQLAWLAEEMEQLPRATDHPGRTPEQRLSLQMLTTVRLTDMEALAVPDSEGRRILLGALLTGLEVDLPHLSDCVTRQYLTHLQPSRQLGRQEGKAVP